MTAGAYVHLEFDPDDDTVVVFAFFCAGDAIEAVLRHFAKKCLAFDGKPPPL